MKAALTISALAATAAALPSLKLHKYGKRQMLSDFNDVDILNYALTLEHLEDFFYRQALQNYTEADFAAAGFDSTFYNNVRVISSDETNHVALLSGALGSAATAECVYSFPSTTVTGFLALANIIEGIGQAAYLGAAGQISSKAYLGVAGSILTVEARHNAYLRAGFDQVPFPQPQDNALTPNQVYTMAAPFIVSCPASNPKLPIRAFPSLAVTSNSTTIKSGDTISVSTTDYVLSPASSKAKLYAAFLGPNGPIFTSVKGTDGMHYTVTVPEGINGQSYVLFTNCNETVSDATTVAGPTFVEITNPLPASNSTA